MDKSCCSPSRNGVLSFDLITHDVFQGWPMYAQLLIDLFKYLAPFLRNVELNKPMQILYKVNIITLA